MNGIVDWVLWSTGATLWTAGGMILVLIAGLYVVEWLAQVLGWYGLLLDGVAEAARKRQIRKTLKRPGA